MNKKGVLYSKAVGIMLVLIFSIFYVSFLSVDVRAISACCEKTIANDYCQYTNEENCDLSVRGNNAVASCEQTSYCQLGCCYGLPNIGCSQQTSKATCEAKGGYFSTDASCQSIQECKQVCCKLGDECTLSTQDSCNELASSLGISPEIKDAATETQCLSYCKLEESGCCTTSDSCSYVQASECSSISGSFNPGKYCSSLSACSECKKHSYKSCLPGNDDVYWFDSCGNQEERAEDCNYLTGTTCGEVSGNIQCKSIDCKDTIDNPVVDYDGVPRKNGESWCGYEGATGLGRDLVGSRHYRHVCINGEEIIEPCADYREEYCTQGILELNGKSYTEAFCVPNLGDKCLSCSSGIAKDDKSCCESTPSCYWTGDERVGSCLPIVPPGDKFWLGTNERTCDIASQDITVYWQKETALSDWDCVGNCQVVNDVNFAEKFNSYCAALGDCGAYYNYIGEWADDGYSCSRSGASCRGSKHGTRFDLAKIDKAFYGTFESLKKATGIEFQKLSIDDIHVKLPDSIKTIGAIAILGGAVGLAALTLFDSAIISKYGAAIGTALAATAYVLLKQGVINSSNPVGWILIGAAVVFILLSLTGDEDDQTFSLSCNPWQAPPGGDSCNKCDSDPLRECTEYRCKSLGQNCEYIFENEGTSRPKCYNVNPNDINSPVSSPLRYDYELQENLNGFNIQDEIPANKRFRFGIMTDELSQCKFSPEKDKVFNDMDEYFGESFYSLNHNLTINPVSNTKYEYYVRCRDKSGNVNQRDYLVSFSSSKGPDLTPAVIEYADPVNNGFVAHNVKNVTADIYLNEPASCRYSSNDKSYESMTSSFNCLVSQDPESDLYRCQASLPFKQPSSTYYIRCKDRANITNTQGYAYLLKGTEQLVITGKKPEGKVVASEQTLELSTSGGAESGKSICRFSASSLPYNAMIDFFETNSSKHTQKLALGQGTYNYNVKCRDIADNEAVAKLAFTVEVDTIPPRITRIYTDPSNLNIVLSEPAVCEYSRDKFTFGSGSNMPEDNSISHYAPLLPSYYIECKDASGNSLSQVRIVT